jgi:hypothetical protein
MEMLNALGKGDELMDGDNGMNSNAVVELRWSRVEFKYGVA